MGTKTKLGAALAFASALDLGLEFTRYVIPEVWRWILLLAELGVGAGSEDWLGVSMRLKKISR